MRKQAKYPFWATILALLGCCWGPSGLGVTPSSLQNVGRIVFIGDSITQGGDYVVDFECLLLKQGLSLEILNLGLSSETAADLTAEENDGHRKTYGFPRPLLSERLDRVLAATRPDLLFACYGMNDGGSLPPDDGGRRRFRQAVEQLRQKALQAGVKRVVICTPPVHDAKGDHKMAFHDGALSRFSMDLLERRRENWDIVDIHGPMQRALEEGRSKDASFQFASDGVHPGREGHWLMAREILAQFCDIKLGAAPSVEVLLGENGPEIRKLVRERMILLRDAWLSKTGHQRPGVAGGPQAKSGLPLKEANAKAAAILRQIISLMK